MAPAPIFRPDGAQAAEIRSRLVHGGPDRRARQRPAGRDPRPSQPRGHGVPRAHGTRAQRGRIEALQRHGGDAGRAWRHAQRDRRTPYLSRVPRSPAGRSGGRLARPGQRVRRLDGRRGAHPQRCSGQRQRREDGARREPAHAGTRAPDPQADRSAQRAALPDRARDRALRKILPPDGGDRRDARHHPERDRRDRRARLRTRTGLADRQGPWRHGACGRAGRPHPRGDARPDGDRDLGAGRRGSLRASQAEEMNLGRDNHPELRDAVRALCSQYGSAYWQQVDEKRAYPEAFVEALTKAGWMSALIPEEYGGSGLSLTEATVIMEEVTRSGGNAGCCHGQMYNMNTLLRNGSDTQKKKYLPKIAAGELRLQAMAVTEPTAGTDTTKIKTVAVKKGDRYVVNGQKVWTSRLQHSELMLLLARTTPLPEVAKKSEGLSIFLVDLRQAEQKGMTVRPIRNMTNH